MGYLGLNDPPSSSEERWAPVTIIIILVFLGLAAFGTSVLRNAPAAKTPTATEPANK